MDNKKWLAAYTRPRYEKKIHTILVRKNITCYLPLIKTLRQWTDRKKWVEIPLFSSYVFVQVSEQEYLEVLKVDGVVKYVSFEGKAVEVPAKHIENIKWILSTDIKTEPLDIVFEQGCLVEIVKGPLNGLRAEMVTYNNKNIILIRIDQLNRSFEIQIPASHVKMVVK